MLRKPCRSKAAMSADASAPERSREAGTTRRLRPTATAALAAVLLALPRAPAAAESLTEALAFAYYNNPQLLAQRALLRATDEQVPQALANWRPTVTFTGQASRFRTGFAEPKTPTTFSSFTSRTVDLSVTQPVYRGGRTEAQTRQAVNTVESTRAQTL